jgi:hypothetical protein
MNLLASAGPDWMMIFLRGSALIVGLLLLWAAIMAAVNYATNAAQTPGIKRIQALVNTDQDGIPGPVTYTEVRKAIATK